MKTQLSIISALAIAASAAAQWHQVTPTTSPSGRAGAAMCTDPVSGNLLLFGGTGAFSPDNQTWTFNGSTWTQLTPTASPSARGGNSLVYDTLRGVYVMYGATNTSFFGGPSVDETWEFNGTTWSQVITTVTPGGLGLYGAAFDPIRNRTVIYGGQANSFFPIANADTWEYDGNNWALITTTNSPGPLERPSMCWHAGLGKIVMFGGIDPQIGGTSTTWLYDGVNWTAAPVTGPVPPVRTGQKMVYDSVRGVCVLTGGNDPMNGNPILDTWEFNGAGWTQIANTTPGRWDASAAFMPGRRKVVLFGGWSGWNPAGETWEYGAHLESFGTGCAGTNGVPALTANDAPRLGTTCTLSVSNLAPAATTAVFAIGFDNATASFGALPFDLVGFGMPGCNALVSDDVIQFAPAVGGNSTLPVVVPNAPSVIGFQAWCQAVSLDPAANAGGMTVSNALAVIAGR